jgi:hypothetical protein
MRGVRLLPRQKPEYQQIGGLKGSDRYVGEILVPIDNVTPYHGAKLVYRNT